MDHASDCEGSVDCTCEGVQLMLPAVVFLRMGAYIGVVPAWAYEHLLAMGIELELAEIQSPPEHPDFGSLEI